MQSQASSDCSELRNVTSLFTSLQAKEIAFTEPVLKTTYITQNNSCLFGTECLHVLLYVRRMVWWSDRV